MGNLRLDESFAVAKENGNKIKKLELARILWPDSKDKTAHTNMSNLTHGKVKKIDIDAVPIICEKLGVTADYLFGISKEPTKSEEFEALRSQIETYLERMDAASDELKSHLMQ